MMEEEVEVLEVKEALKKKGEEKEKREILMVNRKRGRGGVDAGEKGALRKEGC